MHYLVMHHACTVGWVTMAFPRTKTTVLEFAARRVGSSTDFMALNHFLL